MSEAQVNETQQQEASSEQATEGATEQSTSILDKYTVNEAEQVDLPKDPDQPETEEKLFAGKYKTPEEMEKGYAELVKKLGERMPTAPDEYSLELPEGIDVDSEDPMLNGFKELAKKHNIPNETFNELVKWKLEMDSQNTVNFEAEMEKLGSQAGDMIKNVSKFFSNKLSEEGYQAIQNFAVTAENVKVLDELRKSIGESSVPTHREVASKEPAVSEADAAKLLAESKELYKQGKIDEAEATRKKASEMFQKIYG